MKKIEIVFLLLITFSFLVNADVINVPADYSTIQAGLNAADSSDTVLVQPGTYYENIVWPHKNGIKLISAGDSSNTIIDGGRISSVIYINPSNTNIDSTTLIKGFTIQNGGNIRYGGGILISGSNPKLKQISIKHNNADENGGGIYCKNSSPILTDLNTSHNSANYGGGIHIEDSSPILRNIIILNNSANHGGGISCWSSSPILVDIVIFGNSAGSGGGVSFQRTTLTLKNVVISNNTASTGAGIYCTHYSDTKFTNVTISNNSANRGSVIYCWYSSPNLSNITLTNNFSSEAIYIESGNPKIHSCNFINNNYAIYNNDNSVIVEARGNWFGNNSGPYHPTQNPYGQGDSTNLFVNVTPWLEDPDTTAPPPPVQNLHISSIGDDFIDLRWDPSPIGDLSGYKICYKTDASKFFYTDTIDVGNVTSYSLTGLSAGSTYYISAICYDMDGNESWYSKEVAACPQPVPLIYVSTDEIDFGFVCLGDTSTRILTISNQGAAELNVTNISSMSSQFISSDTTFNLPVGEQRDITIKFIPKTYGQITSNLLINSNGYNDSTLIVRLSGFGDLSPEPKLLHIEDIPDDQGGKVRLKFRRSKYDGLDSTYKIVSYTIWRLIENNEWDAIGMFNAVQDSFYYYVAPTLGDSTIHGIVWSTFKVSAHTENPDIFFFSDSIRGYSIDNIAPGVPEGLLAKESNGNILLIWQPNSEKDFQYYKIYRSINSNFDPDTMVTYTYATSDTFFYDCDIEINTNYYYRISAVDYAGNESEYSPEVSASVVGLQSSGENIPAEFSLSQNYPNPFNSMTTITYQLPKSSFVRLAIYDINGRCVEELVNAYQDAGYYSVNWNADKVSSGIYFYRIDAGEFSCVKKCLIVK